MRWPRDDIRCHGALDVRVLITGANGFVGSALCGHMRRCGHEVVATVRGDATDLDAAAVQVLGDLGAGLDWARVLTGVEAVVHLAAVTHADADAPPEYFRRVNVAGTLRLARAAVTASARRFVFMSSIKVNGDRSPIADGVPVRLSGADQPQPQDIYGTSKWEAEQALFELGAAAPLEVVVLRPPLLYGPGHKGNMLRLMRWIARRIPLPLASVANQRSLLFVDNLVAAVALAVTRPDIPSAAYTLADVDLSTPALVELIARHLRVRANLFRMPVGLLGAAARLAGAEAAAARLTSSLIVDSSAAAEALGWQPAIDVERAMAATAAWYRREIG